MRRLLDGLFRSLGVLAAVALVVIGVSVLTGVSGRLLGYHVQGAIFIATYSMGAMAFFALAHTLKSGGHIRVTLFLRGLSPRVRRYFEIWCLGVGTAILGFFSYNTIALMMNSYEFGITSVGVLPIPIWIPQMSMAVGAVVATIAFLDEFLIVARGGEPTYGYEDAGEPEKAAESKTSE
jgi:TRAP-type C4-dicarboxylate transport system permease small subunit